MTDREEWYAPSGYVWTCAACGRRALHRMQGGLDEGWDQSCFLRASLVEEDLAKGREPARLQATHVDVLVGAAAFVVVLMVAYFFAGCAS